MGTAYLFTIDLLKDKQFLGICGLNRVDSIHRSALLGISLHNKRYWGQGLGSEAVQLLMGFGFNVLNLHRIYLTVFEDNLRAKRLYEKVGFKETGFRRDCIQRFGQYFGMYMMDILVDEHC